MSKERGSLAALRQVTEQISPVRYNNFSSHERVDNFTSRGLGSTDP